MAYYEMPAGGGGGPDEPWCTSCKTPIAEGQRSVRIAFAHDPLGHRGLTGLYHEHCSRVFASLARTINLLSFRPF